MSDSIQRQAGWLLPILLAISTSAALGFGFLYLTRPNAGELGSVKVVVTDEEGKSGSTIRVTVYEAPFVQKETVSPGPTSSGMVNYPIPYLAKPNLKLQFGKRKYQVTAETETGFSWIAEVLTEDLREGEKKGASAIKDLLLTSQTTLAIRGQLKPGIVYEDFSWEAKGLRGVPPVKPPATFEQKGTIISVRDREEESVVHFPVPYQSPPKIEFTGRYPDSVLITECTPISFKWRAAKKSSFYGEVTWSASGIVGSTLKSSQEANPAKKD